MADNEVHGGPPGTAQADRLYRGFPDFSAWGPLSPEDADLWSRFAASLNERRQAATPEALKNAVDVAVRAAALDTGAIEGLYPTDRGFTMTVAFQGLAWQQMVEERGTGVRELFEAQLAAYELVLDAVTHKLPITEAWIRSLHETLCAPQEMYRVLTDQGWQEQKLPQGEYKTRPNHVRLTDGTVHAYAPVDLVSTEMHRLVEQIRTPEFEAAHPVFQASYCHYAFVVIHPFADGNGRVARALASTFFYRALSIPLLIFANQRPAYLDALALADQGDFVEVIEFFRDRGIDTMQLVAESLMTAAAAKPEAQASRLSKAAKIWRDLPDPELKAISDRILREIERMLESKVSALNSKNFSWFFKESPMGEYSDDDFKCLIFRQFTLGIEAPRSKTRSASFYVFWSSKPRLFPFRIRAKFSNYPLYLTRSLLLFQKRTDYANDQLEARLQDVVPELTPNFLLRLDQWVQRQLSHLLTNLAQKVNV